MRPSIQRSTEQIRVSPAAAASTARAPSQPPRFRDGQVGVGSDSPQPGELGADGGRGVHVSAVPVRPVHPDQVPANRAVVSEGGVLAVREERESSVRQRVPDERGQRHLAEPGNLRAYRRHPATVTQEPDASKPPTRQKVPLRHRLVLAVPASIGCIGADGVW